MTVRLNFAHIELAAVVGACAFVIAFSVHLQNGQTARIRARLSVLTTWIIAIAIWPFLYRFIVQEERHRLAALPGLLWPMLILVFDIMAMRQHTYEAHVQSKRSLLSMDANAICSLTFAIASIIGAQKHKCCNRVFLFAVIGCIAFVMPSPHTSINAVDTMTVEAVQKAILAYATGLLLTGIVLVVTQRSDGVGLIRRR